MTSILNFELISEKTCIHSKCKKNALSFNSKLALKKKSILSSNYKLDRMIIFSIFIINIL